MRFRNRGAIATLIIGGVTLLVGCDGGNRAGQDGRVIEQNYTRETNRLGAPAQQSGEVQVRGRREIVEGRTEKVKEDIPTVIVGQRKADLNRMDEKDFRALGLNQKAAKNAVQFRKDNNGHFGSVEDLARVPGMDQDWLAQYRDKLAVIGPSS